MDLNSYAEILKFALQTQIQYVEDEWDGENEFQEGIMRGLAIAMDKIDASSFLRN